MEAIGNYIVIKKIVEGQSTSFDMEISSDEKSVIRYFKAEVVSSGNLVTSVGDGDIIYYDKRAGDDIMIDGSSYIVISEKDVVVKL